MSAPLVPPAVVERIYRAIQEWDSYGPAQPQSLRDVLDREFARHRLVQYRPRAPEPAGVSVHDPTTDELLDDDVWTVLYRGQFRELRLRVGRGALLPPRPRGVHARAARDDAGPDRGLGGDDVGLEGDP